MLKIFKKWDFRTKASVIVVFVFLMLFFICRLSLYIVYYDFFSVLALDRVGKAFLQGFRFDFSMISTFVLPLLLMLNLPVNSKKWAKFWLYLTAFVFLCFLCTLVADFVYFSYVKRHMAEELISIGNEIGYIVKYALTELTLPVIAAALGFIGIIWYITRLTNKFFSLKNKKDIIRFIVIMALIVFGIRGKVFEGGKAIGVADVHRYAKSMPAVNLTINGIFTSFHTMRKKSVALTNKMPFDAALKNTENLFNTDKTFAPDPHYPLMRQIKEEYPFKNHNVFIVLLESWNVFYIDSLNPLKDKTFGVTPNFDKIVKDSAVFINAYASGMRSIIGFGSAFAGVPYFPSMPLFGYGLELSNLTNIGADLQERGYYTLFAQASNRDSYRMCSLASGLLGMEGSYGKEDIPLILDYKEEASFGYDYETLLFAADKVKDQKNFFAITFTATTHDPFTVTLDEFEKYPRDSWDDKYLNSLYYADYSIGALMDKAKKDGWFDNTIFIFLSDHNTKGREPYNIKNKYKIPFVVYAPKIIKAKEYSHTVSQSDLVPTLYNLLNIHEPYTALGKDIFDESPDKRFAFIGEGLSIGIISGRGALVHNGMRVMETEADSPDFDKQLAEDAVLSLDKAATTLLRQNRWMKDESLEDPSEVNADKINP